MKKQIFFLAYLVTLGHSFAADHGGGGGEKAVEAVIQMNDIVIPVLLREEVQAYYSLSLTLEAKDEEKKHVLNEFSTRIRDAIIRELYIILPLIWNKDEQPDLELIKSRLIGVVNKSTPPDTLGILTINSFQLNDAKKQGLDSKPHGDD